MKEKYIKIYGLQRTGTNYMEWSLNENLKNVNVLKHGNLLGWKHGDPILVKDIDWSGRNWENTNFPDKSAIREKVQNYQIELSKIGGKEEIIKASEENRIKYLFCIRDPYSWLASKGPKWAGFENPFKQLEDVIDFWNAKLQNYVDFSKSVGTENCAFVSHPDIVLHSPVLIKWISERFKIDKMPEIKVREEIIGPGEWDPVFEEDKKIDKDKYANLAHGYNNLPDTLKTRVAACIDPKLMLLFQHFSDLKSHFENE